MPSPFPPLLALACVLAAHFTAVVLPCLIFRCLHPNGLLAPSWTARGNPWWWLSGYVFSLAFVPFSPNLITLFLVCCCGALVLAPLLLRILSPQYRAPREVVLYNALASPSTTFRREVIEGRWHEHREPLAWYITKDDIAANPAATEHVLAWLRQFEVAPGLYVAPTDNEVLEVVDSLRLYPYIVSPSHITFLNLVAKLLMKYQSDSDQPVQTPTQPSPRAATEPVSAPQTPIPTTPSPRKNIKQSLFQ